MHSVAVALTHLLALVRDIAGAELRPKAAEYEAQECFPREVFRLLGQSGLLSLPYPERWGGGEQPYEVYLLSLSKGENRAPEYLAVNPMGKVPAIRHGDTVITEVAAICTYLADEFTGAKLSVSAAPSCTNPA